MRVPTTTFLCDVSQCPESVTVHHHPDTDQTAGYLALVDKGWKVRRRYGSRWQHVCREHELGDLK